jgi:hypothetical protein
MVIITSMSFPPESATEVGKRFLETSPVPDTLKGPYIKGMKDGIQAFELYELDTLKISEGLEYAKSMCHLLWEFQI